MADTTLANRLQRWGEARHALDQAIQNYVDKTRDLQSDLHAYSRSGGLTSVQHVLPEAWIDEIQVPANYSKLAHAQTHLNQIRNSFLPINTLPIEILVRIFWFSAFRAPHTRYNIPVPNPFERDHRNDLLVLTHVCAHWRTVLLNTQAFWSRFEFNTRENLVTATERAQAYLDRAPDLPLSFYIDEHPTHLLGPLTGHPIAELLEARLNRIARLALLNLQDPRFASDIIMLWIQNGQPGTLRTLAIRMDTDYWYNELIDTRSLSVSRERVDSFLAPVCVLYLNGLRFDWDSPLYHNLVVLRIGGFSEDCSPRIHEMLAILSACPQLHSLQLHEMSIRPSDTSSFNPIHLTELENLGLTEVPPEIIGLLLSAISPRTKDLSLRMGSLHIDENLFLASIRPFLTRSSVTRLFIQRCIDVQSDDISWYLSALPNLHTLLIGLDKKAGDKCLSAFMDSHDPDSSHTPLCPQLHTIHLLGGSVSIVVIQRVVETHPHIRKLRFSNCDIAPSENELRHWLKPLVEDVRFDAVINRAETFDWYHLMD